MHPPIDITGRWAGSYFQHNREFGISAIFAQVDVHLQGKMIDAVTEFELPLFEAALEAGLPPGADEQIIARLRREFPDAPPGPIRCATRLPELSTLEGLVEGRTVRFIKRYVGDQVSGWLMGDRMVGDTTQSVPVRYVGRVSDDGDALEGHWWVTADREGSRSLQGSFLLYRQAD